MTAPAGAPLVELDNVRKSYALTRVWQWREATSVHALDGVTVELHEHETLGIVGETGSGKTTIARLILRLETPTSGHLRFRGRDIAQLQGDAMRDYRASVQAVLQDPWSSLNPRMRVRDIVAEPLVVHRGLRPREVDELVAEQLIGVGLERSAARAFPHEFSGGQRQRIAIARALILQPALVVLDEPVSSLDVSVAAQVMNLLMDLRESLRTAYLLIAHSLTTVRYLADRVAVIYLGKIVETAEADELFANPLHPYTKALFSAAAVSRPGETPDAIVLRVDAPSPADVPTGCRFRSRCPYAFGRCATDEPQLKEVAPGHLVACHLY